jgi:hypothetical protein
MKQAGFFDFFENRSVSKINRENLRGALGGTTP